MGTAKAFRLSRTFGFFVIVFWMLLRTTLTFFFTPVVKRKQDLGLYEYNLLENVLKNLICYWLFDLCSGYASGLIISFIDGLIRDYFI